MKDKTKITKFEEIILIIEIVLLVVIIISLCVSVNYLEKVNSIIGVLAMFVSIVTIVYTEEARKKQNAYEYSKSKTEKAIERLREVIYVQISELSFACLFDMPLNFSKPEENATYIINKVLNNKIKFTNMNSKIYWQYTDEQKNKAEKLRNFIDKFNKLTMDIDEQLNIILQTLDYTLQNISKSYDDTNIAGKTVEQIMNSEPIVDMRTRLVAAMEKLLEYNSKEVEVLYAEAKLVIKEYESILIADMEM